jgi:hypothetical protein
MEYLVTVTSCICIALKGHSEAEDISSFMKKENMSSLRNDYARKLVLMKFFKLSCNMRNRFGSICAFLKYWLLYTEVVVLQANV